MLAVAKRFLKPQPRLFLNLRKFYCTLLIHPIIAQRHKVQRLRISTKPLSTCVEFASQAERSNQETNTTSVCSRYLILSFLQQTNVRCVSVPVLQVPTVVCLLFKLQILDLSNNPRLTQLPDAMGRLQNLFQLNLAGNNIVDPDPQYFSPTRKCIMFLRQRLRGCLPYYRMKLMIVGLAGIGNFPTLRILTLSFWVQCKVLAHVPHASVSHPGMLYKACFFTWICSSVCTALTVKAQETETMGTLMSAVRQVANLYGFKMSKS